MIILHSKITPPNSKFTPQTVKTQTATVNFAGEPKSRSDEANQLNNAREACLLLLKTYMPAGHLTIYISLLSTPLHWSLLSRLYHHI